MRALFEHVLIFSAEKAGLSDAENQARTDKAVKWLDDLGIQVLMGAGRDHGVSEKILLVSALHKEHVLTLARMFDQDTIMERERDSACWLIKVSDPAGAGHYCGRLIEIGVSEAIAQPAYTYVGGRYFVCFKEYSNA